MTPKPRDEGSTTSRVTNNNPSGTNSSSSENEGEHLHGMKDNVFHRPSYEYSDDEFHCRLGDDTSIAYRRGQEQQSEELAATETRVVGKLKLVVFGSLFLSMLAVAMSAYFLTSGAEQQYFEERFYDDAIKILGNMGNNLERTLEASDAFVVGMTSFAAHTNQTWPFVVIPDFAVRAEKIRSLCGAVYVNTYHVVQENQRKEWEKFTAKVGRAMVDESIAAIADFHGVEWPITTDYNEWNVIYDYDELEKENPVSSGAG